MKRVEDFLKSVDDLVNQQEANKKLLERLTKVVNELREKNYEYQSELYVLDNALTILNNLSDEVVHKSYSFITNSINEALERIFVNSVRKIRIKEFTRGQYPQLEIEIITDGGKVRNLRTSSGHGIMQIISLLCLLCLIVITGSRRVLWMDEVLSGLSRRSREVVDNILWAFTDIGFQFVISEHGFIPKGAKVYRLEMRGGISRIAEEYIEENGVYLGSAGGGVSYEAEYTNIAVNNYDKRLISSGVVMSL